MSGDAALQQSGYNEGGSGTESDPYQLRIPNCHDSAIRIENTTAHATIRSGEIWLTHGYAFEIHNNTGTITLTDTRITPAMTLFNASTSNLALRHDNHPPRIGGAIGNAHDSTLTIAGYTWLAASGGLEADNSEITVTTSIVQGASSRCLAPPYTPADDMSTEDLPNGDDLQNVSEFVNRPLTGRHATPIETPLFTINGGTFTATNSVVGEAPVLIDATDAVVALASNAFRCGSYGVEANGADLLANRNVFHQVGTPYVLHGMEDKLPTSQVAYDPLSVPLDCAADLHPNDDRPTLPTRPKTDPYLDSITEEFTGPNSWTNRTVNATLQNVASQATGQCNIPCAGSVDVGALPSTSNATNCMTTTAFQVQACSDPRAFNDVALQIRCLLESRLAREIPHLDDQLNSIGSELECQVLALYEPDCDAVQVQPYSDAVKPQRQIGPSFASVCDSFIQSTSPHIASDVNVSLVMPQFDDGLPVHGSSMMTLQFVMFRPEAMMQLTFLPDNIRIIGGGNAPAPFSCALGPLSLPAALPQSVEWQLLDGDGNGRAATCEPTTGVCYEKKALVNMPVLDPERVGAHLLVGTPEYVQLTYGFFSQQYNDDCGAGFEIIPRMLQYKPDKYFHTESCSNRDTTIPTDSSVDTGIVADTHNPLGTDVSSKPMQSSCAYFGPGARASAKPGYIELGNLAVRSPAAADSTGAIAFLRSNAGCAALIDTQLDVQHVIEFKGALPTTLSINPKTPLSIIDLIDSGSLVTARYTTTQAATLSYNDGNANTIVLERASRGVHHVELRSARNVSSLVYDAEAIYGEYKSSIDPALRQANRLTVENVDEHNGTSEFSFGPINERVEFVKSSAKRNHTLVELWAAPSDSEYLNVSYSSTNPPTELEATVTPSGLGFEFRIELDKDIGYSKLSTAPSAQFDDLILRKGKVQIELENYHTLEAVNNTETIRLMLESDTTNRTSPHEIASAYISNTDFEIRAEGLNAVSLEKIGTSLSIENINLDRTGGPDSAFLSLDSNRLSTVISGAVSEINSKYYGKFNHGLLREDTQCSTNPLIDVDTNIDIAGLVYDIDGWFRKQPFQFKDEFTVWLPAKPAPIQFGFSVNYAVAAPDARAISNGWNMEGGPCDWQLYEWDFAESKYNKVAESNDYDPGFVRRAIG